MADTSNARYPKSARERADREVLADPDLRGARSGRRSRNEDGRSVTGAGDDPARVEREWKKKGRG